MISLPKSPDGEQYEDAVASFIRAFGYFVESRLILHHEGREILELDVVSTPASEDFTAKTLVDAKSGGTGFADLFKIFGWRTFLDIPKGAIIRHQETPERDRTAFVRYEPDTQVSVLQFSLTDSDNVEAYFPPPFGVNDNLRKQLFISGWYAATAERICSKEYSKFKRDNPESELPMKIRKYDRACRVTFFEKDPLIRVQKLYAAFQKYPGLSGECIHWIAEKEGISYKDAQSKLFDTEGYPWAQQVMLTEHRARILIIKNAVESLDRYETSDIMDRLRLLVTPTNFQRSFEKIKKNHHRYKIPYLLHLMIEVFGGYYIDHDGFSADLEMISEASGIPMEDVIDCLSVLDDFFPTQNGWVVSIKGELNNIKFLPAVWRGIGCFTRQGYLFEDKYEEIAPSMSWLLSKYHNVAYKLLKPSLGVVE
ncbi:hypothetical protein FEF65_03770 [Mariprofundus erugo]|uniref:Uncharacterized protein n=1 Tax=Mariprofundus erugo TaxID=2528639 RepID=A0A5R9GYX3_9PROT|nr:hypothetical protein [Mariprofundus erugo]TLS68124.1 hypothetical protein FEF65_03770 [Mariprofundus erugo]